MIVIRVGCKVQGCEKIELKIPGPGRRPPARRAAAGAQLRQSVRSLIASRLSTCRMSRLCGRSDLRAPLPSSMRSRMPFRSSKRPPPTSSPCFGPRIATPTSTSGRTYLQSAAEAAYDCIRPPSGSVYFYVYGSSIDNVAGACV
jgi:hypothetical protein